jgi:hypothetical protein
MREFLREVAAQHPSVRSSVEALLRLDVEVNRLLPVPFFEPVSLVEVAEGKRRMLALSADLLNGWRQHAAHGARTRLRSTERGIFSELKAHRVLSAMILARAHMEAAAHAAYCEQALAHVSLFGP